MRTVIANIGAFRYSVQLVRGLIPVANDEPCLYWCRPTAKKCLVSDQLDAPHVFAAVFAVLKQAWDYECPGLDTPERFGMIALSIVEDLFGEELAVRVRNLLERAGKADAVERRPRLGSTAGKVLRYEPCEEYEPPTKPSSHPAADNSIVPLAAIHPSESRSGPSQRGAQCCRCSSMFSEKAIQQETGPAGWSDEHGCFAIERTLYCDPCGHLQSWLQAATREGDLLEVVLTVPPKLNRNRNAIDAFLRKHPNAANVVVV